MWTSPRLTERGGLEPALVELPLRVAAVVFESVFLDWRRLDEERVPVTRSTRKMPPVKGGATKAIV